MSITITRDKIDNLCQLARIGATDAEKDALVKDFAGILDFVAQIESVEIPENVEALNMVTNVTRLDADAHNVRQFTQVLVDQFPEKEGNYLKVQKILGGSEN